ncbi:entry exclusion lipoprotein TrbK [Nitrosomonas oligotropha]|uniref:Entry exclusion lipoprotein TrbK n=1 Tax=Nitrosomonas oligotropha TaxID=42354 RepID=A0A5C7VW21_9PROT|nr:entry exclusion lipoprotein TrbK [Nitrosomonas oligotropha]MXS83841.1 entry exclusion lipoprotein TrbK [Nitrosomonas oligotropha]TXI29936.1 MAG: entry exclusion lipoprotein TrbK [Nitrosomonas oligotropha]
MNFKFSIVCIIGLSIALIGCGGVPEASSENCSGRGMESSLTAFKNDEAAREAFITKCDELKKAK